LGTTTPLLWKLSLWPPLIGLAVYLLVVVGPLVGIQGRVKKDQERRAEGDEGGEQKERNCADAALAPAVHC